MEIEKMLDEEIKSEIECLGELEPGSEEHSKAVDSLSTLYRLKIDEAKAEKDHEHVVADVELKLRQMRMDDELKRDQLAEQKTERIFKNCIEIGGIVLPLTFSTIWMFKGFKFEETGTFTSKTFQWLTNKFRFKK
jgi:hypothetical protein